MYKVDDSVDATIDVDPATESIGVRVAWDGIEVPDLTAFDHLSCAVVIVAGSPRAEIRVPSDGFQERT